MTRATTPPRSAATQASAFQSTRTSPPRLVVVTPAKATVRASVSDTSSPSGPMFSPLSLSPMTASNPTLLSPALLSPATPAFNYPADWVPFEGVFINKIVKKIIAEVRTATHDNELPRAHIAKIAAKLSGELIGPLPPLKVVIKAVPVSASPTEAILLAERRRLLEEQRALKEMLRKSGISISEVSSLEELESDDDTSAKAAVLRPKRVGLGLRLDDSHSRSPMDSFGFWAGRPGIAARMKDLFEVGEASPFEKLDRVAEQAMVLAETGLRKEMTPARYETRLRDREEADEDKAAHVIAEGYKKA